MIGNGVTAPLPSVRNRYPRNQFLTLGESELMIIRNLAVKQILNFHAPTLCCQRILQHTFHLPEEAEGTQLGRCYFFAWV